MTQRLPTADLCARAIVAAARSLGDDPLLIGEAKTWGSAKRRCLAPAALAIVHATGCSRPALCQILNTDYYGLSSVLKKDRAAAAYRAAMAALGADPATVAPPKFGPRAKAALAAPAVAAALVGTIPAPPVAQRPDHTGAIREALARRGAVARPEGLIPQGQNPARVGRCRWPIGDPLEDDFRVCQDEAVEGRQYCADHCRAAGYKATPKLIQTAGRTARPFGARELGAEV